MGSEVERGGGAALGRITAEAVDRGAARRGCSHCTAEHPTFNRRSPRERSPEPHAPQPLQPVRPAPPRAMAKEGVEKAEETEQMIEKEAGKEPAEGGGGGSHRLGDAQEMRAVVLAGFGGLNKLRVTRKAMPEPQDGELKIRVKAWFSIRAFLPFSLCVLGAPRERERVAEPRWGRRCPGKSLRGRPHSASSPGSHPAAPGRLMLGRCLEVALALPKLDVGVTRGDCELPGGERWMVAPLAQGLEDCAAGALRGVGQLSCQERGFDDNIAKKLTIVG